MDQVRNVDVKETLESLLDRVEKGEEIVITRDGKPVARLVPGGAGGDRTEAAAAIARILEIGDDISLQGLRFRDLIHEGRKY